MKYRGRAEILGKNIFELWEEGAAELEKSAPGRIITAPVRIVEAATTSAEKVAQAPGAIVGKLPLILLIVAVGVGGYLIFAGRKGTKLIPG